MKLDVHQDIQEGDIVHSRDSNAITTSVSTSRTNATEVMIVVMVLMRIPACAVRFLFSIFYMHTIITYDHRI